MRLLPCITLAVVLAAFVGEARAQYVTFGFAPPDRLRFEETHIFRKEILVGLDQPETEIESSKTQYNLRRTANGYSIVATPLTEEPLTESGANLYNAFLSRGTITYDLDTQGQLTGVRGAERAFETLREALSPELTNALLGALGASSQSPNQMAAGLWNGRMILGQFYGRRVRLDTLYTASGEFPLPVGGTARGNIETFLQVGECPAGECVKVFTTYTSTDETVAARLGSLMRGLIVGMGRSLIELVAANDELRQALEEESGGTFDLNTDIDALVPFFEITDAQFKTEDLRLIDPRTGLLYSEIEIQTIEAGFGLRGESVTQFVFKQTHSYDYVYP